MKKKLILGLGCAVMVSLCSTALVSAEAEAVETVTQEDGEAHLLELDGTYEPLFSVLLQEEYAQTWLDAAAEAVGEEAAEDAVAMLQASVSGDLIGQEAAEKYGYFGDGGEYAFYCGFTQDVDTFEIKDGTIVTYDEEGQELSSHAYEFVGYDEGSGFYNYQTTDEDAGEFTYFCFGFDSPQETYHIEFRYGSDLEALNSWVEGDYAYWMASAITVGDDQDEMAKNAIDLFVSENLAGEE